MKSPDFRLVITPRRGVTNLALSDKPFTIHVPHQYKVSGIPYVFYGLIDIEDKLAGTRSYAMRSEFRAIRKPRLGRPCGLQPIRCKTN